MNKEIVLMICELRSIIALKKCKLSKNWVTQKFWSMCSQNIIINFLKRYTMTTFFHDEDDIQEKNKQLIDKRNVLQHIIIKILLNKLSVSFLANLSWKLMFL